MFRIRLISGFIIVGLSTACATGNRTTKLIDKNGYGFNEQTVTNTANSDEPEACDIGDNCSSEDSYLNGSCGVVDPDVADCILGL